MKQSFPAGWAILSVLITLASIAFTIAQNQRVVKFIDNVQVINQGSLEPEIEQIKINAHASLLMFLTSMFIVVGLWVYIFVSYKRNLFHKQRVESQLADSQAMTLHNEKMASLGIMAGGLAHEINNPLTIIDLSAQQTLRFLKAESFNKDYAIKTIERICATTKRIAAITRSLKIIARDGSDDPIESVPLHQMIEDIRVLCMERSNNSMVVFHSPNIPTDLNVNCKRVLVEQVLLNLVSNAIDAVEPYQEKWIKIELENRKNKVLVRVIDSGKGIPQHVQKMIMQPFYTTKAVGKGTGLGLSISKGILQSHGSDLVINSKHENTCFEFELEISDSPSNHQINNELSHRPSKAS